MPTCFVIMGYGIKKDYINNRDIDLDKTFKRIIKPVFEGLGFECKRSIDYPPGIIDTIMYKGIFNADFVIADISTLNPNALYELGVRHALKPYTTLVICEDQILINGKLPFDLSHITALAYRHDGKALDIDEVDRFNEVLKNAVTGMIKANQIDSPVFSNLMGLEVFIKGQEAANEVIKKVDGSADTEAAEKIDTEAPAAIPKAGEEPAPEATMSEMMDSAVTNLKSKNYDTAIEEFTNLLKVKPDDVFFKQQLCLATYKCGTPDPETANKNAYKILETLNPMGSVDTETLGMAGAIHKNLFNITGDKTWLEKSLRFYERGYYVANDYYNGINTAFLYWKLASLAATREETQFYKMQAMQIEKNVVEICLKLQKDPDYAKRKDKEWITNSLAEAYFGLDDTENLAKEMDERRKEQNNFSEDSFMKQFEELKKIKATVAEILK
jgi:hypothetical protein